MKKLRLFLILFVLGLIALLMLYPEEYMPAVYGGLLLFGATVFPTMLPFFFFTKLLTYLDFAESVARFTKKGVKFLYSAPPVTSYIAIMSMLSGYPVGAKLIADFYAMGALNERDAKAASTFCSTSGPLFIVGSIGVAMLGSKQAGYVILAAHYLGAIINGIIFRKKSVTDVGYTILTQDTDKMLSESINSAVGAVLTVGAYICLFNMLGRALSNVGAIGAIGKAFDYFLSKLGADTAGESLAYSLIEVTQGSMYLSKTALDIKIKVAVCTATVSFGGLSVALQSMTFLSKCKVKFGFYLFSKLTQSAVSTVIAVLLAHVLL